ncbi:MAG TPA: hypothetical protein VHG28_22290 [Longimicrobiaceae bacterium]|nr:hypothetical protein [Longimicrobiaceae bacterium]
MRPQVWPAWEAFHAASEARRSDMHDPDKAAALVAAREELERSLAAVLARVAYRTRRVGDLRPGRDGGHVHLAVGAEVSLQGWHRARGQTLCGAPPGRYSGDRPVTCAACLRLLDRHVDLEPDPPALALL